MAAVGLVCKIEVPLQRHSFGLEDEYGNDIEGWGDAESILVFGWEPVSITEPVLAGHDRIVADVTLYADVETGIANRDRLVLTGVVYEVLGEPGDPNNNPWWSPGLVSVQLRRTEAGR